jgi:hypothetical protein
MFRLSQKNRFFGKNFFGALFTKVKFIFGNQYLLIPHSTYSKKEVFQLIEEFYELKSTKCKHPLNIS